MEKEDMVTLEEFREALVKIAADKDLFHDLIHAHQREDIELLKDLMKKFEFRPPVCRVFCYFVCWVQHIIRCARVCDIICFK
jgi:hypothetical protein